MFSEKFNAAEVLNVSNANGRRKMSDNIKTLHMRLNAEPFEQIKRRKKTAEIRLYDEKRRALAVGDTIIFCRADGGEELKTLVTGLYVFPSFAVLFKDPRMLIAAGFEGYTPERAAARMREFYYADEESMYGVLAIGLRLTND